MTGLLTGHCHLKEHLHKLGLVNSPECDTFKEASEMASYDFCDCEALVALRFRHLGQHFMKPGDLEEISISNTALCSRCRAAKCMNMRAAQRIKYGRSAQVTSCILLYSDSF